MVRGQVLEDRLTGSSERLSALIRDRAEDAAAILDSAAARWGEQFDARENQLRGAVNNQNDALETLFDQIDASPCRRDLRRGRPRPGADRGVGGSIHGDAEL